MASFNKTILVGNLTRDPQVKYTTGGTAICEISLAVNREWFDKATNQKKSEVTYVDVTYFGKIAEVLGEYTSKGSSILSEGRLQLDQWDDRETGQKRSKLRVIGETMQLLGRRPDSSQDSRGSRSQEQPAGSQSSPHSGDGGSDFGYEPPAGGDEVPF